MEKILREINQLEEYIEYLIEMEQHEKVSYFQNELNKLYEEYNK